MQDHARQDGDLYALLIRLLRIMNSFGRRYQLTRVRPLIRVESDPDYHRYKYWFLT